MAAVSAEWWRWGAAEGQDHTEDAEVAAIGAQFRRAVLADAPQQPPFRTLAPRSKPALRGASPARFQRWGTCQPGPQHLILGPLVFPDLEDVCARACGCGTPPPRVAIGGRSSQLSTPSIGTSATDSDEES
ncbi:unnamed protein product, partial [Ostreobium quekettii]